MTRKPCTSHGWTVFNDENDCDFPLCHSSYDTTPGARNAMKKGSKTLAFCAAHSLRLMQEGFILTSLSSLNAADRVRASETAFINSLR